MKFQSDWSGCRRNPPPTAVVAELHLRGHQRQSQLLAQMRKAVSYVEVKTNAPMSSEKPSTGLAAAASPHMVLVPRAAMGSDAPLHQRVGGAEPGEAPHRRRPRAPELIDEDPSHQHPSHCGGGPREGPQAVGGRARTLLRTSESAVDLYAAWNRGPRAWRAGDRPAALSSRSALPVADTTATA